MSTQNFQQLYEEEKKKNEVLLNKIKEFEAKIQQLTPKNVKKTYENPEENNISIIQRAFRKKIQSQSLVNLGKLEKINFFQ